MIRRCQPGGVDAGDGRAQNDPNARRPPLPGRAATAVTSYAGMWAALGLRLAGAPHAGAIESAGLLDGSLGRDAAGDQTLVELVGETLTGQFAGDARRLVFAVVQ